MAGIYVYRITSHGKRIKLGLLFATSSTDAWAKTSLKCNKKMLLKHNRVSGTIRCLIGV